MSIIQLKEVTSSSISSKTTTDTDATLLVLREMLPSMEEFNIKALPIMEDLKKLQRQAADQVRHWLLPLSLLSCALHKLGKTFRGRVEGLAFVHHKV